MRRDAHAQAAEPIQAYLAGERKWPATNERDRGEAATGLPEKEVAGGRTRIERPGFARLHASIAEQQFDWAWQQCPDAALTSGESERSEASPTGTGFSARALWLGGIAFALLAAGMIWALAMVHSGRPLPFETWARRDLMQRADGMPMAPRHDAIAALVGVGAARPEPVAAPAFADHLPAEIDAALGAPGRVASSDVDIAGVGPILASAAAAEELAADLPMRALPGAVVGIRAERLLPGPPRPVSKPTLVSSSHGNPEQPARPATMP